jgi:hypothetical protein
LAILCRFSINPPTWGRLNRLLQLTGLQLEFAAMGFFGRRRAAKLETELGRVGDTADQRVDLPLNDPTAQELRTAVEQRLEADWQMPAFWSQVGLDYANARDDVNNEEDAWAFTDSLVLGYVLRRVEAERSDARPIPSDIAMRLGEADPRDRRRAAVETAADVATNRMSEIRILDADAWYEFDYWAWQFNCRRSRGRRREVFERSGFGSAAIPANVDYGAGLAFGYALRCCEEVSDFGVEKPPAVPATPPVPSTDTGEDAGAPPRALSSATDFDPTDSSHLGTTSSAEDLLVRTEAIFVGIRAPSRLGVAITVVALKGQGVEEGHPQYAAATGVVLFGYAVRMAQESSVPLPGEESGVLNSLPHRADGALDHDLITTDAAALDQLLDSVGTLADDQARVLRVLGVTLAIWSQFAELAADQLRRNLRRNGVQRRFLPSPQGVENLMRLGCAMRIVDELAGESPLAASAL